MSDSKYYTPSIEEFHPGFEFEAHHHKDWYFGEGGDKWVNLKWDAFLDWGHFGLANIEGAIQKGWLRVKYLDREDIESQDWKFKDANGMRSWYEIETSGNRLPTGNGKFWKLYLIHDPKYNVVQIEAGVSDGDRCTFYEGVIKNKSQLKLILQWTGILKKD